jgi:ATP-dependent Lhr-like helicase|tara:strand:+ start:9173 stop:14260 length:5088 start_codon:yes stop_codon:yes gene_type:complete
VANTSRRAQARRGSNPEKAQKKSRGSPLDAFLPCVSGWFRDRFESPSLAQKLAWPVLRRGKNTLLLAPTGSGKTLAAFLTAIDSLYRRAQSDELEQGIQVLYISPLKALGNDIHKNLLEPLDGIQQRADDELAEIQVAVRTGDTTQNERARMVRRPPHILITTPESLYLLLGSKRMRPHLRSVRTVIVDEVHDLCSNKRGVHLAISLERLAELADEPLQRIGCSATLNPLEEIAAFLVGRSRDGSARPCSILNAGIRKDLDIQVRAPLPDFLEASNTALWSSAYELLLEDIADHDTTLVFTNSRYKAERTALHLSESSGSNVRIGAHHGSMSKDTRLKMEDALKSGKLDALVATSSLELGIDIGSVDIVYQLESPKSVAAGLQRVGRAGHLLDATSQGRVLVFERDELLEAGAIFRAMKSGELDAVRMPGACLDVLAQQIVGAVSTEPRQIDGLFELVTQAYPYAELRREAFDAVIAMLAGDLSFEMTHPPIPLLLWDRVSGNLSPTRSAPNISFMCVGTIPENADYEVVIDSSKKRVGTVHSEFVDDNLRRGDVFVLGSSAWRVVGVRKNRLLVEQASAATPTVPWWLGDVVSRTFEVGTGVGVLRRLIAERLSDPKLPDLLKRDYYFDEHAAAAVIDYVREQHISSGLVPDERTLLIETWADEMGRKNVIVHSPYGSRINRTWGVAISTHAKVALKQDWTVFAANDVFLMTRRQEIVAPRYDADAKALLAAVDCNSLDGLVHESTREAMAFGSSFGNAAACALQVLRAKHGKRIPPWLQTHRAAELHEAAAPHPDYPVIQEVVREYSAEKLDVSGLSGLLSAIALGKTEMVFKDVESPSPFAHSVLVETVYKDDYQMGRDRRANLLRLHRRVLEEVLSKEQMAELLDPRAIERLEKQSLHRSERTQARSSDELAQCIRELGDLPANMEALDEICADDPVKLLKPLIKQKRLVAIRLPECEQDPVRLVTTDFWRQYHDAFQPANKRAKLRVLLPKMKGNKIKEFAPSAAVDLIPAKWRRRQSQDVCRSAIIERFLKCRGPVTPYDVMNQTGWPLRVVERCLDELVTKGEALRGVYCKGKPTPQWVHKTNLEKIHRYTMEYLKLESEPCAPYEFVDFVTRWQHRHPDTRLQGLDGLRTVIEQLQGIEVVQAVLETEILPQRVSDYHPDMLDQLISAGEVHWRRLGTNRLQRGRISLCLRKDAYWLAHGRRPQFDTEKEADVDIPDVIIAVRAYFLEHGQAFFDEMLEAMDFDEGALLRAVWHLVWCGEVSCDTFECIRHANFTVTLSACYDLDSTPRKIVSGRMSAERVIRQMQRRRLDPRLGRWFATDRLVPPKQPLPESDIAQRWASLLLARWGIVTKDILAVEVCAPSWAKLAAAFKRLELLGKINRGYFIESHQGEQYGLPEAIELLGDCRGRRGGGKELGYVADEPVFAMTSHDPANLYAYCLDIVDGEGNVFKRSLRKGNLTIYCVVQAGQAMLHRETQLVPLSRDQLARCITQLQYDAVGNPNPLRLRRWNSQPIEASPAAVVFSEQGFQLDGRDELCWPAPKKQGKPIAGPLIKEYAPYYSEVATVEYGPDWFVDHASERMRPCVVSLLEVLVPALAGPGWHVKWSHMYMHARYRGVANVVFNVGKTVCNLRVGIKGNKLTWVWNGTLFRVTNTNDVAKPVLAEIRAAVRDTEVAADDQLEVGGRRR